MSDACSRHLGRVQEYINRLEERNEGLRSALVGVAAALGYGDGERYAADEYDREFDFLGWHFHFWGDDCGDTPKYGATMSRDGETWGCKYDYMYGAGFDDIH